ncbi:hypothetical protein ACO1O0_003387 [Amphichorda felina]
MAPPPSTGTTGPRIVKRVALTLFAFVTAGLLVAIFTRMSPLSEHYLPAMREVMSLSSPLSSSLSGKESIVTTPLVSSCTRENATHNPLTGLDAKIAIQTYKRPKELRETLSALTTEKIPSLLEIVVVWNNIDEVPPADFVSRHGVPVRHRRSEHNSLNQKLLPDPSYRTKAVLLSDDDVYYEPSDLEFVFQSWRKFGTYRLVGALPRCSDHEGQGWKYGFCSSVPGQRRYSMILTNLCFAHMALLDYYWSPAPEAVAIRAYVDAHFNCEDIGLNFLASSLTGWGPLEANGFKPYHNMEPAQGISRKPGHLEARTKCLNDFASIFGCMPLIDETSHIVRGMAVL